MKPRRARTARTTHRAHLLDVRRGTVARGFGKLLDPKGEPRQRRAEIVRDRGEHRRAPLGSLKDAVLHRLHRLGELADFSRAAVSTT